MIQGYRMSLFKSKCSKSKLLNTTKIAEHSKVFYLKFTDSSRQEHDAVTVSKIKVFIKSILFCIYLHNGSSDLYEILYANQLLSCGLKF